MTVHIGSNELASMRARWNSWAHGMDPDLPDYPMNVAEFRAMADEIDRLRAALRRIAATKSAGSDPRIDAFGGHYRPGAYADIVLHGDEEEAETFARADSR